MKKHNEGYVLPLVLVVMIVMCLIAVSVMSVALHNLQAQRASVARMQAKYEAQGDLEVAMAKLRVGMELWEEARENTNNTETSEIRRPVEELVETVIENTRISILNTPEKKAQWIENDEDGSSSYIVPLCVTDEKHQVQIICTIFLEKVITLDGSVHFYRAPQIVYTSYEIGGVG